MTVESSLLLLFAIVLFIIKPGPGILATVSRSLADGFPAGFAMALGNTAGQILFFMLAVLGYSIIEAHMSFLSFFMKSAGAAYLIYIGVKGILHLEAGLWGGKPDVTTEINLFEHFLAALFICLSNPFTIFFYAAIIPQIVPLKDIQPADITLSLIIICTVYIVMHGGLALIASRARSALKNEMLIRRINLGVSIIFILLGLFFVLTLFPGFNFGL
jgi:threonine/homoserine/homoserine lactone efflux protein